MNNEPVAWVDEINTFVLNNDYKQFPKNLQNGMIPLYTHPAKTLTDDEILDICIMGGFYDRIDDPFFDKKTGAWSLDEDLIQFARAILRKAQEK
jgi:hypothetical protein